MRALIELREDRNTADQICIFTGDRINKDKKHMYAVYAGEGWIQPIRICMEKWDELLIPNTDFDEIVMNEFKKGVIYDEHSSDILHEV